MPDVIVRSSGQWSTTPWQSLGSGEVLGVENCKSYTWLQIKVALRKSTAVACTFLGLLDDKYNNK